MHLFLYSLCLIAHYLCPAQVLMTFHEYANQVHMKLQDKRL